MKSKDNDSQLKNELVKKLRENGVSVFSLAEIPSLDWGDYEKNKDADFILSEAREFMLESANNGDDFTFDYDELQALRMFSYCDEVTQNWFDRLISEVNGEHPNGKQAFPSTEEKVDRARVSLGSFETYIRAMIFIYSKMKWVLIDVPEYHIREAGERDPDPNTWQQGEA